MARVGTPVHIVQSVEAYFELEAAAQNRHEFVDGQMFLMTGSSVQHAQIVLRLAARLLEASEDTNCEVVNSNW
ncbi:MAG: Uma2 family endonuclease [Deinococcales bacterium]